jgi:hypothetical protein
MLKFHPYLKYKIKELFKILIKINTFTVLSNILELQLTDISKERDNLINNNPSV